MTKNNIIGQPKNSAHIKSKTHTIAEFENMKYNSPSKRSAWDEFGGGKPSQQTTDQVNFNENDISQ
jgi:hypothetical protein